jgi:hypothetical protein
MTQWPMGKLYRILLTVIDISPYNLTVLHNTVLKILWEICFTRVSFLLIFDTPKDHFVSEPLDLSCLMV